jgi:signal transduction histidine kinase
VPADLPVPEARDEVRSLALTLNDMLDRLAAAQQRQRDLVSDTAHELRSPIASIRAQLEVALDHPDGQDWASTARDVHADTLRLARLAEDLLLLARLDERVLAEGGARRPGGTVDLAELSRRVAERYGGARVAVMAEVPDAVTAEVPDAAMAAAAADRQADDDAGPGTPDLALAYLVPGDRDELDRLLVNLVDNAVRYAKSQVTVSVSRESGWIVLAVTDDGPGIPAADLEGAFDRFARLDDARSRDGDEAGGAGLGLAIVRATAQAYGGTAHLEAVVPAAHPPGLRAVVRLPAATLLRKRRPARRAPSWYAVVRRDKLESWHFRTTSRLTSASASSWRILGRSRAAFGRGARTR